MVCVGVPLSGGCAGSGVSVTVIEYVPLAGCAAALLDAGAATTCVVTLIERTSGGIVLRQIRQRDASDARRFCTGALESARHCTKRAFGLAMAEPPGSDTGSDHSLHVRSGRAELPARVRNTSVEPGRLLAPPAQLAPPRYRSRVMHRRFVRYLQPLVHHRVSSLPEVLVAATMKSFDGSRRVVSPSFVWTSSVSVRSWPIR